MLNPRQMQTLRDNHDLFILVTEHGYIPDQSAHRAQAVIGIWAETRNTIPKSGCPPCIVNYFKEIYRDYHTQLNNTPTP